MQVRWVWLNIGNKNRLKQSCLTQATNKCFKLCVPKVLQYGKVKNLDFILELDTLLDDDKTNTSGHIEIKSRATLFAVSEILSRRTKGNNKNASQQDQVLIIVKDSEKVQYAISNLAQPHVVALGSVLEYERLFILSRGRSSAQ